MPTLLAGVLARVVGYLLGSINTGIIISRVFFHDDVRTHGSGSAGMTNMIRTYGKAAGAGTAVGDVLKGVCAALLGGLLFSAFGAGLAPVSGRYLAGIAAMFGHMFPIYFGFKGGKGVLCAAGAVVATLPQLVLALLVVFLVQFAITRIVSLGSIIVAAAYPFFALWFLLTSGIAGASLVVCVACAFGMAGMVIYMHRSNISRLRNGTEYRFTKK